MSKGLKITFIVIGVLIIAGGLLAAGFVFGQASNWLKQWRAQAAVPDWRTPQQMRPGYGLDGRPFGMGPGGMWNRRNDARPYHRQPRQLPNGDDFAPGFGCGPGGVMGGFVQTCPYFSETSTSSVQPLTVEEAKTAVENYLKKLGNDDLSIGEVMVFDNHAYVRVVEESTGTGAMELLVAPGSKTVYPEFGPNMMWNLKYGRRARMMGRFGLLQNVDGSDMTVTAEEAVKAAQEYLDNCNTGATAEKAEPFYGYYTLDVLKNGKPVGMLSVNGYTGQVFYHHWHGKFLTMSDEF